METYIKLTEVTVSVLPESDVNRHSYQVQVAYRGDDRYAVMHLGYCLGTDGEWEYETHPSAREDDWLATHRFDYDTAYRLAIDAAPSIECNGVTAAEIAESLPCGWPERSVIRAMRDEGCGICAGCIGMGPCDDGAECGYGCGARVLMPGDVCDRCEDEATGRGDDADERYETEYADG